MNCKYKRIRTNKGVKYGYCTLLNDKVDLFNCKCSKLEYRYNSTTLSQKCLKSAKIIKLEHNRHSLLTNNLTICIECGKPKNHLHEIYFGNNRINSMKYNCVIPLCSTCHNRIHNDISLDLKYKKMCQLAFEKEYTSNNFIDIFHKNYKI